MKIPLLLPCLLFSLMLQAQSKQLEFYQTDWGRQVSWDAFCQKVKAAGYHGVETWFPSNEEQQAQLKAALKKYGLKVGFLHGTDRALPFPEALTKYTKHFKQILAWKPAYINCHTGSDFMSFEQNKAFLEAAIALGKAENVPIYHETHRGRFSYNLPDTRAYLEALPELKLTLDISHWMVVHESLLQGKDTALTQILERSHHIHARVGHAQGPQVNDPQAPEWQKAVERHLDIWEKTIRKKWKTQDTMTVTTEFGPANYMPTLPHTQVPVANQWKANVYMMAQLKARLQR
ncbi:sugar phosphate isomerase/epimerase family protein [Maribacter sp. 2307ULW6-5]|uniref:sugar phosphate isomerase/epimerase family protein n=1 Tax=Maribacter sp. 2307ULW6-5 TaxID=3386275 RepID=UPI0039BD451E